MEDFSFCLLRRGGSGQGRVGSEAGCGRHRQEIQWIFPSYEAGARLQATPTSIAEEKAELPSTAECTRAHSGVASPHHSLFANKMRHRADG